MLFTTIPRDYEVVGVFEDNTGKKVTKTSICHNTSKRAAKERMKHYIVSSFSDTLNIHKPIKVGVKIAK